MPTIDELVGDVMHLPLPRRAPRLRSLLQHYVRHTLLYNYMASPDAVEEALHLWNAVESPDRPRDSGLSRPEGACRRCASSPETPATPSSSRRCRPRRHHLGLHRRSAPRSTGRGSVSRTARLLLHRRALHTPSFPRAAARAQGLKAAGASVGKLAPGLLLPGRGATSLLPEQHRRG
jgi:hypothetical protein